MRPTHAYHPAEVLCKRTYLCLLLLAAASALQAQSGENVNNKPADRPAAKDVGGEKKETTKEKEEKEKKNESDPNDYGWSDKIGFIVGAGMNNAITDIFAPPTIDRQSGQVQLQHAERYRSNLSFGISYTFGSIKQLRRTVSFTENGEVKDLVVIHRYPSGISTTIFINPGAFSDLTGTSVASTVDLGLGIGYRHGPWSLYGTCELFKLSQPREYFVERYWGTDQQYTVNGEVQSGIDTSDSSIFVERMYAAVGFKLCYNLSVFKQAGAAVQAMPTVK